VNASLPRIHLCGPIAAPGEAARGGYQACNRRTIEALGRAGHDVVALPYPHPRSRGLRKQLEYGLGFLRLYARVLRCERGSIFHLTALAAHFVWNEWPLLQLARWRGCRVVHDLRAGAGEHNYARRGAAYRLAFRACLRAAHQLLVEGESLVPFVERVAGRRPIWLPNHLDTEALPWREAVALPAAPTLAYVGRIVPEKGVELLLEAAEALRTSGLAVRVRIAGDGDAAYLQRLRSAARALDVDWLGPLSSRAVLALLREAHFFIFATRHLGEGQSNALTEAMACGCVPLASDHGFNQAVIGDASLILPATASASDYAAAIRTCWPLHWARASRRMQERARACFSTAIVLRLLLQAYARAAETDVDVPREPDASSLPAKRRTP
jgi:glycosyltransferase involved in cell wall biosynthesis